MKYLHIFKNSNVIFSEPYIDFINSNFNSKEHFFYIIGNDKRIKKTHWDNIYYVTYLKYGSLIRKMQKAEKIILHGLSSPKLVVLLRMQPKLLKRCYWVVWGADLHYYKSRKKTIKHNIYEHFRRYIIKNFGHIVTLVDDDFKVAKEYYNIKGKYHHSSYINPINLDLLNSLKKNGNINKKTTINIQIGNSADPSNNHLEVLNKISKYKDENIRIYLPLSYGNKDYALKIKKYGEEIFKEKFIAITDFLEPEDYVKFLETIDIAIFANNRQQALGNIFALTYLGKKIYLRNDVSTWNYLNNQLKIKIFDYLMIEKNSFEDFIFFEENIKKENKNNIKEILDIKRIKLLWENIFKEII